MDEQGNPTGYELDVVKAVMDDLGYQVEWVKTPFEQAFTGLLSGKYQMNASAIYTRCARIASTDEYGHFSVPVGQAGRAITARAEDAPNIQGWEDMAGLVHGVESAGSTADLLADDNAAAGFSKQILPRQQRTLPGPGAGSNRHGRPVRGRDALHDQGQACIAGCLPPEGSTLSYGFIFQEGDPLREKVNETLDKLKENGTTAENLQEMVPEFDPEPDRAEVMVMPEVTAETCKG